MKKTPLHDRHLEHGARMVPFAGFDMPVQYSGVTAEHRAVRSGVGIFDVSHMGEIELFGPRAVEVADRLVTNHIARLEDGQAAYTCLCRDDGGIVDDLVVYRIAEDHVLMCVNAANREKDFAYVAELVGADCKVEDTSERWAQIAVQGPGAETLVAPLCSLPLAELRTYRFALGEVLGVPGLVARTGYTGEDGFELYLPADRCGPVWDALAEGGATPAGLGARDSLRLEMAYPLYGNDIDESTHPFEAGLGWVVKMGAARIFAGRAALEAKKANPLERKLSPLVLTGRGIARAGYPVLDGDGNPVGRVTSGTQAPTVEKAIALAYLPTALSSPGTAVRVEVRGRPVEAEVTTRPFLRRGANASA